MGAAAVLVAMVFDDRRRRRLQRGMSMAPDLDQDPDEQVEIEKAVKAYYLLM